MVLGHEGFPSQMLKPTHWSGVAPTPNFGKDPGKTLVLVVHICVVLVVAIVSLLAGALIPVGPEKILWDALLLTMLSIWCLFSWHAISGGIFNPYGLFLLSTLAFN